MAFGRDQVETLTGWKKTMLSKRLVACLDVRDGHLAKSIKFVNTKNIGDPVEKAR